MTIIQVFCDQPQMEGGGLFFKEERMELLISIVTGLTIRLVLVT